MPAIAVLKRLKQVQVSLDYREILLEPKQNNRIHPKPKETGMPVVHENLRSVPSTKTKTFHFKDIKGVGKAG